MRLWPVPSLPLTGLCMLAVVGLTLSIIPARSAPAPAVAPELPSLPNAAWLNSPPLTLKALRGRPVLVEFWTFDCSNCRNSLPWMKSIHDRYAPQGLAVIAVHSPELEHERNLTAVAAHVKSLGIHYPVLVDNDFRYWTALNNGFWPAFYLIDPQGRVVATRIGELHRGERSADDFERSIAELAARN
jgi:thiol-disulfide isomerase/thioredoxin